MTKNEAIEPPEHWADLPSDVRSAMIDQAKDRLFWKNAFSRLGRFSKLAQALLIIITAIAAFRSGMADWILGAKK
ncbi:hypothetical protein HKX54_02410 [Sulfitobacter sp. M57]|uniref:hypothetical protein n=1 Tax=unclassified Sulfitobacter TaxID=196795 RepID=UPI0023E28D7F|nr:MULTISPECIES: hypothetical protein [unclassified Sulfitobacter]MDF3413296.1 hypothetical protein [Sulfitobacter sp. KE5]MDF3421424.1 hypothetical protein [Sulfitobacter sp. KE43]MDF3431843.1 hypothetical protein [Sulfitobacter sp. KE42]MDF3457483.1 hypothetical protein [Sulfitobacter sp. S74]MDF3461385.1 hypothetical protein [Sulfitobacter sp. Ks18]